MGNIYQELLHSAASHNYYNYGDRVVLEVCFANSYKTYCYSAPSGEYEPGQLALVWTDNGLVPVTIERAHYFSESEYPYKSVKLKSIENVIDENEWVDDWKEKPKTRTVSSQKVIAEKKLDKKPETERLAQQSSNNESINKSDFSPKQSEHNNPLKAIFIIVLIIGVFLGPGWYEEYSTYKINSQQLIPSEITGKWTDASFNKNNTMDVSFEYVTGKWEIVSSEQNLLRISYFITDEQLARFTDEYVNEVYGTDEYYEYLEGYAPDRTWVMDVAEELYYDSIPPTGIYEYKRSENRLVYSENPDYYLKKQ